jgi:hypothetical protein
VFYPECKVSNTTVLGKVDQLVFKATGKQIIEKFMTIEQKYTIILNLDKLDALNNEKYE